MPNNVLTAAAEMLHNVRVLKRAHFIAGARKAALATLIALAIIVINALVGSGILAGKELSGVLDGGLFERVLPWLKLAAGACAFLAAALAGVQSTLDFKKQEGVHKKVAEMFVAVEADLAQMIAAHSDGIMSAEQLSNKLEEAGDAYHQATVQSGVCLPTDRDFARARKKVVAERGR
ncbi:MAG: SLATT domain-containing protein [Chitinivibrionales bacterium]|nr:SLATT domain-containing protein [Chitinivibrionales bacterium]